MTDRNQFVEQLAAWLDADIPQAEAFYDTAVGRDYITQDWQSGIIWAESAYRDYPANDGSGDVDVLALYVAIMPEGALS